ncbi:AAA family ATPase [Azospirillum sp. TSH64]|uniref:AAA family ATPase n=1 Tax=Azospirillum sp. TSH64 TaxID=652740 RepID=UPI000D641741|nr:AAA family ATPase [Azospirillum sp. TSH64]
MTLKGIRLHHLSFLSPKLPAAIVPFKPGLNVIYGASNTGKSFILEAIDFMLGGRPPLRDIPERVGYDRVLLGLETLDGREFTLLRSVDGGAFKVFIGLYDTELPEEEGQNLGDQHNDRRDDNLSVFLLSLVGFSDRKLRKNANGGIQSLSFRNLARLLVVNEEEIIQQRSPLSDGNYVADTANTAVFKLMITGMDDSALMSGATKKADDLSREAQLGLLAQMIKEYTSEIKDMAGKPSELEDQLLKLETAMESRGNQLSITEEKYRVASSKRRELMRQYEEGSNRLAEISSLIERFNLLSRHYDTDIERLRGIEEAGILFTALGPATCPLCGAAPEFHQLTEDCEGDVSVVIEAARAEVQKLEPRRQELAVTMATLHTEGTTFATRLPRLSQRIEALSKEIEGMIGPSLRQGRAAYAELANKRGEVREALAMYRTLSDLHRRREILEREADKPPSNYPVTVLTQSAVNPFSEMVKDILELWKFPDIESVTFDLKDKDLIVNGKKRSSFGKGLRAITQSAFTIGLMEYCRSNDLPHPGFVVLDSPLLSYRKPEGPGDDLRGTDVNEHFYLHLSSLRDDRQVIVIENTDPPADFQRLESALRFTANHTFGRAGLFPMAGTQ